MSKLCHQTAINNRKTHRSVLARDGVGSLEVVSDGLLSFSTFSPSNLSWSTKDSVSLDLLPSFIALVLLLLAFLNNAYGV